jgi:hypothetical protein
MRTVADDKVEKARTDAKVIHQGSMDLVDAVYRIIYLVYMKKQMTGVKGGQVQVDQRDFQVMQREGSLSLRTRFVISPRDRTRYRML